MYYQNVNKCERSEQNTRVNSTNLTDQVLILRVFFNIFGNFRNFENSLNGESREELQHAMFGHFGKSKTRSTQSKLCQKSRMEMEIELQASERDNYKQIVQQVCVLVSARQAVAVGLLWGCLHFWSLCWCLSVPHFWLLVFCIFCVFIFGCCVVPFSAPSFWSLCGAFCVFIFGRCVVPFLCLLALVQGKCQYVAKGGKAWSLRSNTNLKKTVTLQWCLCVFALFFHCE